MNCEESLQVHKMTCIFVVEWRESVEKMMKRGSAMSTWTIIMAASLVSCLTLALVSIELLIKSI